MDLTLNDAQRIVLQWVADGADLDDPPSETFKTSAVALHSRGLVNLDKRRDHWSIAITEAGISYIENGRHPQEEEPTATPPVYPKSEPEPKQEAVPNRADVTSNNEETRLAESPAKPERIVKAEAIPIPDRVRRPHRAVREIIDHKARLDMPTEQRQRALLLLHALAQEAVRRGWEIIAIPSTIKKDPWNGRNTRVSPGPDLFSIDAGDALATFRLRMQQKRVDHIPTEKELADQARYSWNRPPLHDYVPTERMRLELRSGSSSVLTLDDTVATRIEDKLLRAVEKVAQMSVDAREAVERHRQWEIQRAENQRRADELRERAANYGTWVESLEQLRADFVRHRELVDVVANLREAIEQRGPEHKLAQERAHYLAWSEEHLEQSDPLNRIWLPRGERPDLTYEEWREWKRQHPKRY